VCVVGGSSGGGGTWRVNPLLVAFCMKPKIYQPASNVMIHPLQTVIIKAVSLFYFLLWVRDVSIFFLKPMSCGSAVGMAAGYGQDDRGVGVRVKVWSGIETGSGAHPDSYPMGTGVPSPGRKRQERETDHSSPTSAEMKKTWTYTSTPPYVFLAQCVVS
jgi:hypothetical protein